MINVTSITAFMSGKGQEIAYSYAVIDENTGATIKQNERGSMTVVNIPGNRDVLESIATVNEYVRSHLEK